MSSLPTAPLRVVLVGAGRVGTAVAILLQRAGHEIVSVSSRSEGSAAAASERLGAPVVSLAAVPSCDLILLGVPEGVISAVVETLGSLSRDRVVVHFSGASGIEPLSGAVGAAGLCALHPVQACPDVDSAVERLPGSAWGVTCSEGASAWAHRLISEDLGGVPFDVAEADRVLWHAAAVTTSNGISALMAAGEGLLASIGIPAPERVLGPIASGTVENARSSGGGGATLTGPVVREEATVISRHVAAVTERAPDSLAAYLLSLQVIIEAARSAGRIDDDQATSLRRLLETA